MRTRPDNRPSRLTSNGILRRTGWLAGLSVTPILTLAAQLTAKPVTWGELNDPAQRTARVTDAVFWNRSRGMKQFHERMAEGPMRIAILQVSARIQGDVADRKEDIVYSSSSTYEGWYSTVTQTYTEYQITTVPGFAIPQEFGYFVATNLAVELANQLRAKGFEVIPADRVAATRAYQTYLAGLSNSVTVEDASTGRAGLVNVLPKWALFAPPGMRIRPQNTLTSASGDWLPVESGKGQEYLQALSEELGGNVLFVQVTGLYPSANLVRSEAEAANNRVAVDYGRVGVAGPSYQALIHDPTVRLPAMLRRFCCSLTVMGGGVTVEPRPQFIQSGGAAGWRVDWLGFTRDALQSNAFFAEAIATRMQQKRTEQ